MAIATIFNSNCFKNKEVIHWFNQWKAQSLWSAGMAVSRGPNKLFGILYLLIFWSCFLSLLATLRQVLSTLWPTAAPFLQLYSSQSSGGKKPSAQILDSISLALNGSCGHPRSNHCCQGDLMLLLARSWIHSQLHARSSFWKERFSPTNLGCFYNKRQDRDLGIKRS